MPLPDQTTSDSPKPAQASAARPGTALAFLFLSALSLILAGCGSSPQTSYLIKVAALPSEDISDGGCKYQLQLDHPSQTVAGVFVILQRGDSQDIFNDPSVRAMADQLHYAIILAEQCYAASFSDMQPDASKGPGRTLLAALTQFAADAKHPELATSNMVVYGFSASAVLAATLTNYAPARILGAIEYAPSSAQVDIEHLPISKSSAGIPTLILTSAQDPSAGTTPGLDYFQHGRALAAPWAFGAQNQTVHCCSLTTRSMVLAWVPAIVALNGKATTTPTTGTLAQFLCAPNTIRNAAQRTELQRHPGQPQRNPRPRLRIRMAPRRHFRPNLANLGHQPSRQRLNLPSISNIPNQEATIGANHFLNLQHRKTHPNQDAVSSNRGVIPRLVECISQAAGQQPIRTGFSRKPAATQALKAHFDQSLTPHRCLSHPGRLRCPRQSPDRDRRLAITGPHRRRP